MRPPLWENDDLWAVEKPIGQNVIPGRDPKEKICLQKAWAEVAGRSVYVIHRLDQDTSGLVLFAKTPAAHRFYSMAFENRRVKKNYLAVVTGLLTTDQGIFQDPLRAFGSGRTGIDSRGKPSETRYTVLQRLSNHTLVRVQPITGRRHQIRAHFAFHGHPLLGDPLYGPPPRPIGGAPRLMLHAERLIIPLPNGSSQEIVCNPPPDFLNTLRVVGMNQISYLQTTP